MPFTDTGGDNEFQMFNSDEGKEYNGKWTWSLSRGPGQGRHLTWEQGPGGAHLACAASPSAGSAACAPARTSPLPEKDHTSPASTLQARFPVRNIFPELQP